MNWINLRSTILLGALALFCNQSSLAAASKSAPQTSAPQTNVQTPATTPANKGCASGIAFVDMNRIVRDSEPGKAILDNLNNRAKKIEQELADLQGQMKPEEESDPMQQQELQQKMMNLYQSRQELYQAAQQFIPMLFNDVIAQKIYSQEMLRESGFSALVYKDVAIVVDSRCDITDMVIGAVNALYASAPAIFASPFDENATMPMPQAAPSKG